jgi:hypothetical protein
MPQIGERKARPSALKLTDPPETLGHPAFRGNVRPSAGTFLNFMYNFLPRSPTKDTFDPQKTTINDSKEKRMKQVERENKTRHSIASIPEEKETSTEYSPVKTDEYISGLDTPLARNSKAPESDKLDTTPSKAAKLLGLTDSETTPSKATRILGTGLECDEELLRPAVHRRVTSGEGSHPTPSRRMARIIEGAAARLNKVRNSVEYSDSADEMMGYKESNGTEQKNPEMEEAPKPKLSRVSSLKYMDNNSIPPTPPDKDTIYGQVRLKGDVAGRPHIKNLFKGNVQTAEREIPSSPLVREQKGSLRVNLVSKPSIYSISGVIEEDTMRGHRQTEDSSHRGRVSALKS